MESSPPPIVAGLPKAGAEVPERVVRDYFAALSRHDVARAVTMWAPGAPARHHGLIETTALDGVRDFLDGLFASFPDLRFELLSSASEGKRCFVRWRMVGTFNGTQRLHGIKPTGARLELEGAECFTVEHGLIAGNDAYGDVLGFLRRSGVLPDADSRAERRLLTAVNLVTTLRRRLRTAPSDG
ncbi:MAG: nuclear transport factor 2 family protein [Solirubrobacteraceae bacterium]